MATNFSQLDLKADVEGSHPREMAITRSMAKNPGELLSSADELLYNKLLAEGSPSDRMLQLWAPEESSGEQSEMQGTKLRVVENMQTNLTPGQFSNQQVGGGDVLDAGGLANLNMSQHSQCAEVSARGTPDAPALQETGKVEGAQRVATGTEVSRNGNDIVLT